MFLGRVLVGLLLLLLFIFSLFNLSNLSFHILSLFLLCFLLIEWLIILDVLNFIYKILYILFILFLCFFIVRFNISFKKIIYFNFFIWIFGFISIIFYSKLKFLFKKKMVGILLGVCIFIPWWYSLNYNYNISSYFKLDLFFVCILVIMSDIFGFFFGYTWGKRKIFSDVSPKKTWFGVGGSIFSTFIIVIIFLFILDIDFKFLFKYIFFSYIILFISIIGDLLESIFKRSVGIKNSSNILLFHGGILDRFDSILSSLPVFIFLFKF